MNSKGFIGVLIALACLPAAHAADKIDFEDCDVLAGKSHVGEFKKVMADERKYAASGDPQAKAFLAGIANNRFACLAEAIGGDGTGWTATVTSNDPGQNGSSESTTKLADSELIRKNRNALSALHEAHDRAQELADTDAGYRSIAAQFVADYPALFAHAEQVAAYRDATGTAALSCGHPGVLDKSRSAALCSSAKSQIAGLTPRVDQAQRAEADAAGQHWADDYARHAGSK